MNTTYDSIPSQAARQPRPAAIDDLTLAQRIGRQDHSAFEQLMRRYNGQLFRVARAILKDAADAEDALQEAYLSAYRAIGDFHGTAALSTWLTRIVINQALGRLRSRRRNDVVVAMTPAMRAEPTLQEHFVDERPEQSPEYGALQIQIRRLLENKIDALPVNFRTVFILREVEELTVEETAECLGIPAATVRTRLHRARAQLRESLAVDMDAAAGGIFPFGGTHCDRMVSRVLERLASDCGLRTDLPKK